MLLPAMPVHPVCRCLESCPRLVRCYALSRFRIMFSLCLNLLRPSSAQQPINRSKHSEIEQTADNHANHQNCHHSDAPLQDPEAPMPKPGQTENSNAHSHHQRPKTDSAERFHPGALFISDLLMRARVFRFLHISRRVRFICIEKRNIRHHPKGLKQSGCCHHTSPVSRDGLRPCPSDQIRFQPSSSGYCCCLKKP